MSDITIKELGISISENQLLDAVEERIFRHIMHSEYWEDEDGNEETQPSKFAEKVKNRVIERIDEAIDQVALKHVIPNMEEMVENHCLQKTTEWGEKVGEPMTFTEYLVDRAFKYMKETVDNRGKTKVEEGYGWSGKTTRIAYMIDSHLQYSISSAIKQVLADGNKHLVSGLHEAIKIKLVEISNMLKVEVKTK